MNLGRHLLVLAALYVLIGGAPARPSALVQQANESTTQPADQPLPKNIIVFIADGAGYNMLQATRLWTGEALAMDGPEWTKFALATYALRSGKAFRADLEPLAQDPGMRYDPQRHYDIAPVFGERRAHIGGVEVVYPRAFGGYELHRRTAPDSAATATAMFTGVASYNGAINVDGARKPLHSLAEKAKLAGKRVGIVTTGPWIHATSACAGGAHNVARENYHAIAREMLWAGVCDVLAGTGHPEYDNDGRKRQQPDYTFYGATEWQNLKSGQCADSTGQRWRLVEDVQTIRALAEGDVRDNIVLMPPVGATLQQRRTPADHNGNGARTAADAMNTAPGEDPPTPYLPTLVDLSKAALNAVDDEPAGFFLMIEGGAVDWAMHDNQLGRAIEEYMDFNAAIQHVVEYLNAGANGTTWDNTLVIVTADHDHLLYGPDADKVPFQELADRGPGVMPGHRWLSNGHSNSLVPLFARGPGSERLATLADEIDLHETGGHRFGRGPYLHQAELGGLLKQLVEGKED